MKTITIEVTNEQFEYLGQVSQICNRKTSEFIKEALMCLLPIDEYSAVKNDLIIIKDGSAYPRKTTAQNLKQQMRYINMSTSKRLKRIGMLQ
jgi:hypothetical protein